MFAVHVGLATSAFALAALGGLTAACAGRDDQSRAAADAGGAVAAAAPATTAGATAVAPRVVTVTTSDYSFHAPSELPAGLTTFRLVNKGPSPHHVQLVRLDEGKTAADLVAALKAGGPPPSWVREAGGPNPAEVGEAATTTVGLEVGQYVLVCFITTADGTPHFLKGMTRPLTVTGPAVEAAEPAADVVMTLTDYDFSMSKPLTAGPHVIRVENAGPQAHEVTLVRLKPGKTPEDFAKWGSEQTGSAPGTLHGGVSGIMPGTHAFIHADLPAGDYALICWVPDAKDGRPHYAHGMSKRIKVS